MLKIALLLLLVFLASLETLASSCKVKMELGTPQEGQVITELPVSWLSSYGADVKAAGEYEKEAQAQGVQPDPEKLHALLGGTRAHLRLNKFQNGLRFVTIHTDDGTQIFDDTEYAGLFNCACGANHGGAVTSTKSIKDTDLGDGIILKGTLSGRRGTVTYAEKDYSLGNTEFVLKYHGRSTPENEIDTFGINFRSDTKEKRMRSTDESRLTKSFVEVKAKLNVEGQQDLQIIVAQNLSENMTQPLLDQIVFKFDSNGKLVEVAGISESEKTNPVWNGADVSAALLKGERQWFKYPAKEPKAQLLAQIIFGSNFDAEHDTMAIDNTINTLMAIAIHNKHLDLQTLIQKPKTKLTIN